MEELGTMLADVYQIDPINDPRWAQFLAGNSRASIFHTPGWLRALQRTYGYKSIVFTTSRPGTELQNGLPFSLITTWLTDRRLVSLPFSDHCAPLVENPENLTCILSSLQQQRKSQNWNYVEIRSCDHQLSRSGFLARSKPFYFHSLDLRPSLDQLFDGFHKDCIQRKIHRAERESLICEEGRDESLLRKFYHLLLITRRRHGLAPQPKRWFRNLVTCLGDAVKIRVVSKDGRPVAAILTLQYNRTLVYKYGCSDRRFANLGGTQLLMWKAIQQGKNDTLDELDMGRSDYDTPGLVIFKDRWGATRSTLWYMQTPARRSQLVSGVLQGTMGKYFIAHAPDGLLAATGSMLYRHMG